MENLHIVNPAVFDAVNDFRPNCFVVFDVLVNQQWVIDKIQRHTISLHIRIDWLRYYHNKQ